ncbi:uncharacterized protein CTRU02_210730 [Colletotrichum truncatum]|uniref:Uncharacterized protein n=1 Tax=Colletotrichum truncatum TaxID=5467 RepID=A0ACC3YPS7_COLTU
MPKHNNVESTMVSQIAKSGLNHNQNIQLDQNDDHKSQQKAKRRRRRERKRQRHREETHQVPKAEAMPQKVDPLKLATKQARSQEEPSDTNRCTTIKNKRRRLEEESQNEKTSAPAKTKRTKLKEESSDEDAKTNIENPTKSSSSKKKRARRKTQTSTTPTALSTKGQAHSSNKPADCHVQANNQARLSPSEQQVHTEGSRVSNPSGDTISPDALAARGSTEPPALRVISANSDGEFIDRMADDYISPVGYFDFGPLFKFDDTHINKILRKGPMFTRQVIQITAGSPELRLPISDAGLVRLVAACPRLEYLSIHGATRLSETSFQAVVDSCVWIRHIALCGADFEPNTVYNLALHDLTERRVALFLNKIALKNTAVQPATVKKLRDARPNMKISADG